MSKVMTVSFPGGKKVDVQAGEQTVHTDQSVAHGGEGTAPEPFDVFLASIAACAGIYALEFCNSRKLDSAGLGVTLNAERDDEKKRYTRVRLDVKTPAGFPEKYRDALLRSVDLCAVKKHILNPPEFSIVLI